MKKWIAGGLAVLAVIVGLYAVSPYWAARQFLMAAQEGDADELDERVDFPAVRDSLKSQLNAQFMAKLQNDPEMRENPFAALGVMLVPAMVDQVVSGYVTPNGIAAIVKHGNANVGAVDKGSAGPPPDVSYEYASLNRFNVILSPAGTPNEPLVLVFERQGLFGWQVIRLDIPEGVFETTPVAE